MILFVVQKESVQSFYKFYVGHLRNELIALKEVLEESSESYTPSSEEMIKMPHPSIIQIKEL